MRHALLCLHAAACFRANSWLFRKLVQTWLPRQPVQKSLYQWLGQDKLVVICVFARQHTPHCGMLTYLTEADGGQHCTMWPGPTISGTQVECLGLSMKPCQLIQIVHCDL